MSPQISGAERIYGSSMDSPQYIGAYGLPMNIVDIYIFLNFLIIFFSRREGLCDLMTPPRPPHHTCDVHE